MYREIDNNGVDYTFVTGPMYAAKSQALILSYRRAEREGDSPVAFKPAVDTRDGGYIVSRDLTDKIPAIQIANISDINTEMIEKSKNAYIDEAFMFEDVRDIDSARIALSGLKKIARETNTEFKFASLNKLGNSKVPAVVLAGMEMGALIHCELASCEVCRSINDYSYTQRPVNKATHTALFRQIEGEEFEKFLPEWDVMPEGADLKLKYLPACDRCFDPDVPIILKSSIQLKLIN